MNNALRLAGIAGITALFIGCAASSKPQGSADALLPEIDVVQVKEKSDEALKLAQEAKLDIEVLTTRLTELDSRVLALSEEMTSISSAKIEELETRLALLTEAYKDLHAQVQEQSKHLSLAPKRSSGEKNATFAPSSAASLLSSAEYTAYQNGLRLYNAGNYDKAIETWAEMLKEFPSGNYADDGTFWIAEGHYALARYPTAVIFYQKVIDIRSSPKADDAQYKLGLCYLKMGQQGLAKDAFKMLVQRYPASEYVKRAGKQLKGLK
ncbi:MAG: tetratricopeptide repeat protein [Chitinispirillaceae bacterium]|nr:tetratricopeptide repeat protein [Chitinispirillaceae bacterium]